MTEDNPSEAQMGLLLKLGVPFEDAKKMNRKEASKKIEDLISQQKEKTPEKPLSKSSSPKKDDTSFYTAYAKDIFIQIASLEKYKNVSFDVVMDEAIRLVKQAKSQFEKE